MQQFADTDVPRRNHQLPIAVVVADRTRLFLDEIRARLRSFLVPPNCATGDEMPPPLVNQTSATKPRDRAATLVVGRRSRPRDARSGREIARAAPTGLIWRRRFTVHFHAYASADYRGKRPQPRKVEDLDQHHSVAFGAPTATHLLYHLNSLLSVGRDPKNPRIPQITVNNLCDDACGRARRRRRCVARLLRAARIGTCAPFAASGHAGDGLPSDLRRGDEERRASSGFSRLSH